MDFKHAAAQAADLAQFNADTLVLVLTEAGAPADLAPELTAALKSALKEGDYALKAGRVHVRHDVPGVKAKRVVFTTAARVDAKAHKAAYTAALQALKHSGAKHLAFVLLHDEDSQPADAQALVAAAHEVAYVFSATKPSAVNAPTWAKFTWITPHKDEAKMFHRALLEAQAIADGVNLAKDCANLPANHATPSYLADVAKKMGKANRFKVEVLDRKDVEKLGMGAFIAVAQGSDEPLKFIVARYEGGSKSQAPVVLVGKGITFDTGGISLKPAADMDEMKYDMGGAASVLGTLLAVSQLKAPVNLVVLIPACENMPSGKAIKPGDVVTTMSGQTVEILNTDAEGRLILCDVLTYAAKFKPAVVVDVATLTGACVVALGHHLTGLYASDDDLAHELLACGEQALDWAWHMPLDEDFAEGLKSNYADLANVGPRAGGSISAAMFLKRFTDYRWAHLDIAGTAWKSGAAKGATGRPVGLLTHFVLSQAQ